VAFPGSWVSVPSRGEPRSSSRLRIDPPDLPKGSPYTLKPGHPTPGAPNLLRPHIASRAGTGILTCFPSTTHFCLALGADSPCADERCAGNLGLTASGPFTRFNATHVSIRTSDTSSKGYPSPSQAYGTLSYRVHTSFSSLHIALNKRAKVKCTHPQLRLLA
jgi:hypothetical protein